MGRQINIENQVEWNMAQLLTMELAKLRSMANDAFIHNNYKKAVSCLVAMKHSAIHVIENTQRKEFEEVEIKMMDYSKFLSPPGGFKEPLPLQIKIQNEFIKLYRKYNAMLQDVLDEYGFLGDRKKDASRMSL